MWRLQIQRARYRGRVRGNALARCWAGPSVSTRQAWLDTDILAVDTETSALNPNEGELLSIGWVCIQRGHIAADSAEHYLISSRRGVGQSAVIHQLRDCELADGLEREAMMQRLLSAASGRLLLFHFAYLDRAFLDQLSRQLYGAPLLLPVVDTLAIEHRKLTRRGQPLQGDSLRLATCRKRYHLPDYPAHNALIDALATAELFMAQARYRSSEPNLRIKDI